MAWCCFYVPFSSVKKINIKNKFITNNLLLLFVLRHHRLSQVLLLGSSSNFSGVWQEWFPTTVISVERGDSVGMNSSHPVALGDRGHFQWHRKGVAPWPAGAASSLAALLAEIWEQKGGNGARLILLRPHIPGGMPLPR